MAWSMSWVPWKSTPLTTPLTHPHHEIQYAKWNFMVNGVVNVVDSLEIYAIDHAIDPSAP